MEYQEFSDRIKSLIKYFGGNTDQGFADFLGLSKTTVFRWRTGDTLPDGASCILISKKCKISIDALLLGEGEMTVENKPHLTAAESQEPYTTNSITEPDHNTRELLLAAQRVLKADHPSAPAALQSNIVCFDQAVADNKRLGIMEQRQNEIIKMLNTKTGTDPPLS